MLSYFSVLVAYVSILNVLHEETVVIGLQLNRTLLDISYLLNDTDNYR